MELYELEFQASTDGEKWEVRCPVCDAVWTVDDPNSCEPWEYTPCRHLRFVWFEDADLKYFGRWSRKKFYEAYRRAAIALYGEDEEPGAKPRYLNADVLRKMACDPIDAVALITQSGLACGPVSFTTFFGIKK